ncbi:aminotransferase [Trichoderma sp. SZMC 28014]
MADIFSLFTSLRYDPGLLEVPSKGIDYAGWNAANKSPFYMLDYHRDRMLRAATHWKWDEAINVLAGQKGLDTLTKLADKFIGPSQETALRFKILVSRDGVVSFEKNNVAPVPTENLFPLRLPQPGSPSTSGEAKKTPCWTVAPDEFQTTASEYTHFKTTKREMYDSARERLAIAPTDEREVLLVNKHDGSIMEGSLFTPYFWRDGQWVTPPVSLSTGGGGQDGVSRRWALERGVAVEQAVPADSLRDGEECWISNGVRGFIAAVVRLKQ